MPNVDQAIPNGGIDEIKSTLLRDRSEVLTIFCSATLTPALNQLASFCLRKNHRWVSNAAHKRAEARLVLAGEMRTRYHFQKQKMVYNSVYCLDGFRI